MNEDKVNQTIGKNLTSYLEKSGRSMSDLARYLNVSQTAVSNWCRGIKIPRMDKIDKICTFFQIKRSDLMDEPIDPSDLEKDFYEGLIDTPTLRIPKSAVIKDKKIEELALITAVLQNYSDAELLEAIKLYEKYNSSSPRIRGLVENLMDNSSNDVQKKENDDFPDFNNVSSIIIKRTNPTE